MSLDVATAGGARDVAARLDALREYGILDTPPEPAFDDIAALAARLCGAPIALISFVDEDRQWFKALVGVTASETDLSRSVCSHAILSPDELVEIPDTTLDPRTAANPLNDEAPLMRFYAGAVLRTPSGVAIGSLCVLDSHPRRLNEDQRAALPILARQVIGQLELRRTVAAEISAIGRLAAQNADLERALEAERILKLEIDHRVKNSLQLVGSLLQMQAHRAQSADVRAALLDAHGRVTAISSVHGALNRSSKMDRVLLPEYVHSLITELRSQAPGNIAVDLDVEEIELSTAVASPFALIVNEFVTNCLKHAFPDGRAGRISLRVHRDPSDPRRAIVRIADDGIGHAGGGSSSGGLGTRIMMALAGQIGAVLDLTADTTGTSLAFDFLTEPGDDDAVEIAGNPAS